MENGVSVQTSLINLGRRYGWIGMGLFAFFLVSALSSYSQEKECSPSCSSLKKDLDGFAEEVRRLQSIREKNERFILSLDPDQSSQLMKAESNIRVANRRMSSLDVNIVKMKQDLRKEKCNLCVGSGG